MPTWLTGLICIAILACIVLVLHRHHEHEPYYSLRLSLVILVLWLTGWSLLNWLSTTVSAYQLALGLLVPFAALGWWMYLDDENDPLVPLADAMVRVADFLSPPIPEEDEAEADQSTAPQPALKLVKNTGSQGEVGALPAVQLPGTNWIETPLEPEAEHEGWGTRTGWARPSEA